MGDETSFAALVRQAAGHPPYPYQTRIAEEGLPDLLRVPTGSGKTLAAVLPWLYRRRFHPDERVRASTPRWLVFALPMRVLVEQMHQAIAGWLDGLGLSKELELHRIMGGEGRQESEWRRTPERDAVFVGTIDMLLSRALNRGYGTSRFSWPIDFGLFNNGCQWVFDEIQLMGPALPTSRQLEGLRASLGTAAPCSSMWMSATVDEAALMTIDRPEISRVIELEQRDRTGDLAKRLDATKRIEHVQVDDAKHYAARLAQELEHRHRPGTLTISVCNTVERAREVYLKLTAALGDDREVVLLHSRYRPRDRAALVRAALAEVDPNGPGRIIVSTQVIEAGVDISATTLLTEAAPWPSIVQRAGRCNRDGEAQEARLLWVRPPGPAPYESTDVDAAVEALCGLDGQMVTSPDLGALDVAVQPVVHPVLRRRDLLGLFDTTPDLSGNDVDVGRFIRAGDDLDVQIAWRVVEEPSADDPPPTRDELCPVPIGQLRDFLRNLSRKGNKRERGPAWRYDHLERSWTRLQDGELRPGLVVVVDAAVGGYDPTTGWSSASAAPVEPVTPEERAPLDDLCEATSDDPISALGRWVALREHLEHVEEAASDLGTQLMPDAQPSIIEALAVAGRLHDIGKAHQVFQNSLLRTANDVERGEREAGVPWGKSAGGRIRHERKYFRHELASALALLGEGAVALDGVSERELVVYLVAAHHGRVRLGIRSLPDKSANDVTEDGRVALGIFDGEQLPAVEVPGGVVPPSTLDLSVMELGDGPDGSPSWSARALALLGRPDLGPFRLGWLEAILRLADWRASADEARP